MKRAISTARLLGPVALAILILAAPAFGTTVEFMPNNAIFAEANLQTVQVVVTDAMDVLGASMTVQFDPAVVTPVAVTLGDFMGQGPCGAFFQWINAGDFVDTIEMDVAMLGCTVSGSGTLFNITFAGVGDGTSPLTPLVADLRDSQNMPIALTSLPGAVTYQVAITSSLSFAPDNVLFEEDLTAEICIAIGDVQDFLGMSVTFEFDPAVLTPLSVYAGPTLLNAGCPFYLDWLNAGTFVNTMEIDTALLGCNTAVDGPIVCILFQGVQFGESPLSWLQTDVRDGNNQTVLVNANDGHVLYDPIVPVFQVSLGALKCIYR